MATTQSESGVESRPSATRIIEHPPIADPAALGLGAFALTTFLLSAVNAGWTPNSAAWIGYAVAYGGIAQLLAGMWEFRNRNVFGATAFTTYGSFWLGLAFYVQFLEDSQVKEFGEAQAGQDVGMILLAFAIFNTYMLLWSTQVNAAVFSVFLTLEATEIVLFLGELGGNDSLVQLGGYLGILTALVAWYASAAVVVNGMTDHPVLPVGGKLLTLGAR
jgi:succinate-acetate transporter protein